jgi:hypothetical protein
MVVVVLVLLPTAAAEHNKLAGTCWYLQNACGSSRSSSDTHDESS